jgi:uncharacterized OsmC-like protein
MADQKTHHVTVRLTSGYRFQAEFSDLPGKPVIALDEPPPLGEGAAPNAAAVLGAAVGNCLAASFTYCLRKARLAPAGVRVDVTTHVNRDDRGRHRISGIEVQITPEFDAAGPAHVDRCAALFEDFCTVTASVRRGIPVQVSLRTPAAQTTTAHRAVS